MQNNKTPQPKNCVDPGGNDAPAVNHGNYDVVRYNAVTHGILSKHAVLPHEDENEFAALVDDLIDEHQPRGLTQRHLVEELAAIIWRKRRVLMAEGAKINEGLKIAVTNPNLIMHNAVPFQHGMSGGNVDLPDLLTASPEEMTERLNDAALELAATQKAAAILRKGSANAYEKARRALISGFRDWWDEQVEAQEYDENAEGLAEFLRETLEPVCIRMVNDAKHQPHIKAQTFGKALQAHQFETLNRYETHLDRKFERTLAMLLKLKELCARGGQAESE